MTPFKYRYEKKKIQESNVSPQNFSICMVIIEEKMFTKLPTYNLKQYTSFFEYFKKKCFMYLFENCT